MQHNDYTFWLDANLPPIAVEWFKEIGLEAVHVFAFNFMQTGDNKIFETAKNSDAPIVIITKDEDFVNIVLKKKSPPKIIWITAGNLSNKQLKALLFANLKSAMQHFKKSDNHFVEIY